MDGYNVDWAWPWWSVIVGINVVNLIICVIVFKKSINPMDGLDTNYSKWMRWMGVIFVIVGAYRSVFVSRYLSQMAWFDSIANSSLLIRILAIAAELSFAGLIAMAMLRVNADLPTDKTAGHNIFKKFIRSKSPFVLWSSILLAQFFATSGLITKNNTLFAIEETLWTIGFLVVLPLTIVQWKEVFSFKDKESIERLQQLRKFTRLNLAWCIIYCSYGLFYHLPLETWPGAMEQISTGFPAIRTDLNAISDAFSIVHESKEYDDWGFGFLLWHSAYFTICVWISIFLMQAPRMKVKLS